MTKDMGMVQKAYIYSFTDYDTNKRICGLYTLERLIYTLVKAGITEIYLLLNDREQDFYNRAILPHIKKRKITVKHCSSLDIPEKDVLYIPSNLFMQPHYFDTFNDYFTKKRGVFEPVVNDRQFLINSYEDVKKAESLIVQYIIDTTGGYIAKKINKRISIPISKQLAKTRIHPNILTIINMIVGFLSAFYVVQGTYWNMVCGGLLFQLASVFDGVDGEVAKFTFKVSKIGGWLDTIGDNGTLLLFLIAVSVLYFQNTSVMAASIIITLLFAGLFWFIGMIVWYLRKYSDSGSLVAYDKEFLQKLPKDDVVVKFALSMKYFTKKEFFALFFFCISFTGAIHLLIPIIAFTVCCGAVVLTIINIKYFRVIDTLR
ncbi:MAG: CDP-alcohol phosphatidyltransferase family protein [Spirochaetes bacterium]|nr:CDP-alcohol phosphatidyltransferase family protein [Spirochaetota bacterium]